MKRLILLTVALLTALGVRSQNPQTTEANIAVVTGEYEKEYEPDEVYVKIIIHERDSKGKISIEEQQNEMIMHSPQTAGQPTMPKIGTITIRATVQARFELQHPAPGNN